MRLYFGNGVVVSLLFVVMGCSPQEEAPSNVLADDVVKDAITLEYHARHAEAISLLTEGTVPETPVPETLACLGVNESGFRATTGAALDALNAENRGAERAAANLARAAQAAANALREKGEVEEIQRLPESSWGCHRSRRREIGNGAPRSGEQQTG